MLTLPHHHRLVARCDALDFVGNLVREPRLQLQAVGKPIGTAPTTKGRVGWSELGDISEKPAQRTLEMRGFNTVR